MAAAGRIHDRSILDALEKLAPEPYDADVWRVARQGRDPLQGSSANGRWNAPGELEVLYTSEARDGALAEIGFRLSLEPVWPSRLQHQIYVLAVKAQRTLRLADMRELEKLGVDIARYESFDYRATQAIAAASHFLEFDGLLVPSARFACSNLVLFSDRVLVGGRLQLVSSEDVDWADWRNELHPVPKTPS
jgi:RES domain-containing protein